MWSQFQVPARKSRRLAAGTNLTELERQNEQEYGFQKGIKYGVILLVCIETAIAVLIIKNRKSS